MAGEPLRAIVGLGNPGADHRLTRHNAGFWFVDALARLHGTSFRRASRLHGESTPVKIAGHELLLFKPDTFMNDSGRAVQALAAFYKLSPAEILVAHDDLDLPPGAARLKRGGGHAGHNGLRSIHQHLGADYLRLRIGIGHPGVRERVLGYVLGRPGAVEQQAIIDAVGRAAAALEIVLTQGWDKATQRLHTEVPDASGTGARD
ncbi:MAG: aminoacyl-tRNA hydrolase [Gammaproteobacteria bacterium]|nr:aminoacyl-tRNA hydrolase [Gammaproteobacteria bacterium]